MDRYFISFIDISNKYNENDHANYIDKRVTRYDITSICTILYYAHFRTSQ